MGHVCTGSAIPSERSPKVLRKRAMAQNFERIHASALLSTDTQACSGPSLMYALQRGRHVDFGLVNDSTTFVTYIVRMEPLSRLSSILHYLSC